MLGASWPVSVLGLVNDMTESFYLIDGQGYSYQAFFALHELNAPDGTPTNAVFGFAKMLDKIRKKQPDYLAVCFDMPGKKYRQEIFPEYKATRKPMPDELQVQMPLIKELLSAYRIPVFEVPDYEGDDVMATLAKKVSNAGVNMYLVTQDKDMEQLVNDTVKIYNAKSDCVIDRAKVEEKFRLPPHRLPEYFALVGDAVDNIPGVAGIGSKTAQNLLQKWYTLEEIYQHLDDITPVKVREKLHNSREQAFLSKKLFVLHDNLDISFHLDACKTQEGDKDKMSDLFRRLGFQSFLAKLVTPESAMPAATAEPKQAEFDF